MLKISTQTAWSPSWPPPHSAMDFPGDAVVKNLPASARDMGLIHGFDPWLRKILWRRKWQPTPVFLPAKFHGLPWSLTGCSPWGHNLVTEQQQQSETIVKPLPTTVANLCNILINTCESVQIFLYHLSVWSIT